MHIPSELGWEQAALDLAASVAERMGFPPNRVEDLKTAVGEAVINAIEHGNAPNSDENILIVLIPEAGSLEINVQDHSRRPFPEGIESNGVPNLEERVAGRAPARGWGTFLIRALVDEAEFSSTGHGNTVKMRMYLHPFDALDSTGNRAEPQIGEDKIL